MKTSALVKIIPRLSDVELAIVMESLEGATHKEPGIVNDRLFALLVECISHAAPRVKWEAARTISNIVQQHNEPPGPAVDALLASTGDDGKVVRWATAQALTAILRTGYADNGLRQKLSEIAATEQDEGVRGVYEKAFGTRR